MHYNNTSVAKFVQKSTPWATITLRIAYKFHPIICELVAAAVYQGSFKCRIQAHKRALLTGSKIYRLIKTGFPIMLIHLPGYSEKFPANSSRNMQQCLMARKAVVCLAKVTQKATVSLCCYYARDDNLAEIMQRAWETMYPDAIADQIISL